MGRSVNYLNNAEYVLYFPFQYDENVDDAQMEWDDTISNLQYEIKSKLKSYNIVNKWDNNETRIILENNLCIIGISEYCGLVSLSVAQRNGDFYYPDNAKYHHQFSLSHAHAIRKTLEKCLDNLSLKRYNKIGSFSNGEGVFEKAV